MGFDYPSVFSQLGFFEAHISSYRTPDTEFSTFP
ncbi:hypothetical protein OROMI_023552 [Orobanche minor]